jgi:hypothetical protein
LGHIQPFRNPGDAAIGQQLSQDHQMQDIEGLKIDNTHRETLRSVTSCGMDSPMQEARQNATVRKPEPTAAT